MLHSLNAINVLEFTLTGRIFVCRRTLIIFVIAVQLCFLYIFKIILTF